MEIANCTVALAGDKGNTVPKFAITAAEIAVLRVLHGDDAVTDILPVGSVERTDRAERGRLVELYGINKEGRIHAPAVEMLFPGAAARVFHKLADMDIPHEFFAATGRMGGKSLAEREPDSVEAETASKKAKSAEKPVKKPRKKRMTKAEKAAAAKAAEEDADEAVGEDMDDSVLD